MYFHEKTHFQISFDMSTTAISCKHLSSEKTKVIQSQKPFVRIIFSDIYIHHVNAVAAI